MTHTHRARGVPTSRTAVTVLLGFLAVSFLATLTGLIALWPDREAVDRLKEDAQFTAPNVTFVDATVTRVEPACVMGNVDDSIFDANQDTPTDCGHIEARLESGPEKGELLTVDVAPHILNTGVDVSAGVQLMRIPPHDDQGPIYSFDRMKRTAPLLTLAILTVIVIAAVARLRGILGLLSLVLCGLVLFKFMLPALLSGYSGIAVALIGSAAIMFVVLYLTHGPSVRTSAALAGTLLGIAITAVIGQIFVTRSSLTGVADDASAQLTAFAGDVSFQGLLMCSLIVAGLGVLNDVTITQASAVWELRAAGPTLSRRELFTSGMRIGRDHIASTIYTLMFAYAGAALAVLLLVSLYQRPFIDLVSTESIAQEIVRTLAAVIGLVLAVPLTTGIAALTVGAPVPGQSGQPASLERYRVPDDSGESSGL